MNSEQRNDLMDAIRETLCPPLFDIEFITSSTTENKGEKVATLVENFWVEVEVCIRPVQISDYQRSLTTTCDKDTLVFAELNLTEKEVITDLLGRVANQIGLDIPKHLVDQSANDALVFKFQ